MLVLVPVLVWASPIPEAAPSPFSFPTQPGTRWVYRLTDERGPRALAYVATKAEPSAPGRVAVLIRLDDPTRGSGGVLEVSAQGVFEASEFPGGAYLRPPPCVLKLPHRDGNRWEAKTTAVGRVWTESLTARGPEPVVVPAGRFAAIRVESEYAREGENRRRQTRWFASGVGLVKWVARDEVWELTGFTPGKQ